MDRRGTRRHGRRDQLLAGGWHLSARLSVTGTPAGATSTITSTIDGKLFVVITTSAATPKAAYNLALNAQSGTQITQVPFILRVT